MTKQITLLLTLLALSGCPTSSTTAPEPVCARDDGPLVLEVLAVERPDAEGLLRGLDLDGETTAAGRDYDVDYSDPDGTPGVDSAASDMDVLFEVLFGHGMDQAIAGQTMGLDLSFVRDAEGACAGLDVGLSDGARVAADWNGATYRAHDLGDVPFTLVLGDVSTEVTLRDVGVRFAIEEGRAMDLTVGGWISTSELFDAMVASVDDTSDLEREEVEDILSTTLEWVADMGIDADGIGTGISFMFRVSPR